MKKFILDTRGSILSIEYLILAGLISFGTLSLGRYLNDAKEEYLKSYLSDFTYQRIENGTTASNTYSKTNSGNSLTKESFCSQKEICP